jgi:predicted nucleic acid-binding protein
MSLYLLDADYLVGFAEPLHTNHVRARTEIAEWLIAGHDIATSSIAWQEFYSGKIKPRPPEITAPAKAMLTAGIIQFGEEQAEKAAELFQQVGRRKRLIHDCAIAATAIIANAELATFNLDDFKRFVLFRLRIVNYTPMPEPSKHQRQSVTQRRITL